MKEVFTKPELARAEERCRGYAFTASWAASDVQMVLDGLNFYRSLAMSLTCEVERLKVDAPFVRPPVATNAVASLSP